MAPEKCRLCKSKRTEVIFEGAMRSGGVGSDFVDGHVVLRCEDCEYVFLSPVPDNLESFYESDEYRKRFYNEVMVDANRTQLDRELTQKIDRIGIGNLRNKIVAEFGCGPGLFLDLVKSVAKETIAIEPTRAFHAHLEGNGHKVCSYGDAPLLKKKKVDVAASFDAIEHVRDPRKFLTDIHGCLNPGGVLYLSMPNQEDLLKGIRPDAYDPFNYQLAHLSYFTGKVAGRLVESVGFKDVTVEYLHKYDIANLLQWAVHGKPGAFQGKLRFDRAFHDLYRSEVERLGIASHLFVTGRKK